MALLSGHRQMFPQGAPPLDRSTDASLGLAPGRVAALVVAAGVAALLMAMECRIRAALRMAAGLPILPVGPAEIQITMFRVTIEMYTIEKSVPRPPFVPPEPDLDDTKNILKVPRLRRPHPRKTPTPAIIVPLYWSNPH